MTAGDGLTATAQQDDEADGVHVALWRRGSSRQNVVSTGFGTVSVDDYARFQAVHTRHHCKPMPGAT